MTWLLRTLKFIAIGALFIIALVMAVIYATDPENKRHGRH